MAEATIRGVCHRAGFSQGAFYTSFASKDDLLLALLDENMQQAISGIEALLTEPAPAGADSGWISHGEAAMLVMAAR